MKTEPYLLHALSPLHSGTGHTPDIIDLPIARMKATHIPFLPGSSLKGVLRDACRLIDPEKTEAVFGPSKDPSEHAGALLVSDARLLALPVRSFRGTFAWTTSPLLLTLAKRDLKETNFTGGDLAIPNISNRGARFTKENICNFNNKLYLEDIDLDGNESNEVNAWAQYLAPHISPGEDIFTKRFVVVDDETMAFLWETATQVDARIRLEEQTRTVAQGALWLEESLPPETVLIGLLAADRSRRSKLPMNPEEVMNFALKNKEILQLGGKATTGRGRCRLIPLAAS